MDAGIPVESSAASHTTTTPDHQLAQPLAVSPTASDLAARDSVSLVQHSTGNEGSAAAGAPHPEGQPHKLKTRKLRQPRISEACIRCKARKTRCVRTGPGVCVFCEGAGTDCVIAPRARRKNARKVTEPPTSTSAAEAHSTTSPDSFQHFLHAGNPLPHPFYPSYFPYSASPPFPPNSLALSGSPHLAAQRPAFPPPPPPPPVHSPYDPTQASRTAQYSSLHAQSPSLTTGLAAPVSDVRSAHAVDTGRSPSNGTDRPSSRTPGGGSGDGRTVEYDERSEDDDEDEEEEEGWHDQAARGVAFLSLSANGNPTYVGPSSGFSWARMVLGGMAGAASTSTGHQGRDRPRLDTSQPFQTSHSAPKVQLGDDALAAVSDELADKVLGECYRHIQPRYAFVDWLFLHEVWQHRVAITRSAAQPAATRMARTAACYIYLVFAIGSRLLQKSAVPNLASPEAYYAKAMDHLEIIVGLHDLKNVQVLLLMVMYSFRSNEAPGAWYLIGIVVRLCCSLGLHRKVPPAQARRMSPYILQLRRRIFWSAYTLDRMMAMSLGRPCGIADHDCDIELPFDVDCIATAFDLPNPTPGPTSMTSSILFTKLMRIESVIQKQSYRVDAPSAERPEAVLRLIDDWEAQIPPIASEPTCWNVPCCSRDWFLGRSGEARLYLLRPLTANPSTADPSLIRLVAKHAAETCEIQKRFHQSSTPLALEALRSIFLTGLTLLHAVRLDRHALPHSTLQRAVRSCSNTMFLYAQAFPGAAAYSDVFEELANVVLDKLSMPPEAAAVAAPPASLVASAATPLFTSLWDDLPTMMSTDTEDSFLALLESLGVPTDSLGQSASAAGLFAAGADGLDLSELGAFAPASGLAAEPFALGSSASGVW
ncbi:hypothetical protein JCM3775_001040 [Rhodotorula graminis]